MFYLLLALKLLVAASLVVCTVDTFRYRWGFIIHYTSPDGNKELWPHAVVIPTTVTITVGCLVLAAIGIQDVLAFSIALVYLVCDYAVFGRFVFSRARYIEVDISLTRAIVLTDRLGYLRFTRYPGIVAAVSLLFAMLVMR